MQIPGAAALGQRGAVRHEGRLKVSMQGHRVFSTRHSTGVENVRGEEAQAVEFGLPVGILGKSEFLQSRASDEMRLPPGR